MCLIQFSSLYKERDREGYTGQENHLDGKEDGQAAWCPLGGMCAVQGSEEW